MFGIGMPEFLLIMAIALIVIGPKKLPDLAKALGKALGEFKKATSELKDSLEIDKPLSDVKRSFDNLNKDLNKGGSQNLGDEKRQLNEIGSGGPVSHEHHGEKKESYIEPPEKGNQESQVVSEKEVEENLSEPKDEKTENRTKV